MPEPTTHRLALPAGTMLGKYRLESVLGSGGFGITYLAEDTALKRQVAIKELLPTDLATRIDGSTVVARETSMEESFEWARARFLDEGQTLAACDHPAVVHVYEHFEENGTTYMVTKFAKGRNLTEWLESLGRSPSVKELEALILPLLDGLELVHSRGFLHRDLKPDNIFLTDSGDPILLDFGSARQSISSRSRPMTSIVSPGYAPFEQYVSGGEDDGSQGPWSDIYAFSAVLIRAITGDQPPEAAARIGRAGNVFQPLAQRENLIARYGEEFLTWVDVGFAVEAADRPQSVGEWRQLMAGDPVLAAPARKGNDGGGVPVAATPSEMGSGEAKDSQTTPKNGKKTGSRRSGVVAIAACLVGIVLLCASGLGWWFLVEGPKRLSAEERFVEASAAEERGDLESANSLADAALAIWGCHPEARALKERVENRRADSVAGALIRGRLFIEREEWENARREMMMVLAEQPNNEEALAAIQLVEEKIAEMQAYGAVHLTTVPTGATVKIVGFDAAATPADFDRIPTGRHRVEVTKAGYLPISREVEVTSNEKTDVNLKLDPAVGSLNVTSAPSGLTYRLRATGAEGNGGASQGQGISKSGRTPAEISSLPEGVYEVIIEPINLMVFRETVRIEAGEAAEVGKHFTDGVLSLESFPSGAVVTQGDKVVGTTPFRATTPSGDYTLGLRLEGYESASVKIQVAADERSLQRVNLEKLTMRKVSYWDHNGSKMRLEAEGDQLSIYYHRVRSGLTAHVENGALLFRGKRTGGRLAGKARRFKKGLSAIEYDMAGSIDEAAGKIELQGRAPKRDSDGDILRWEDEVLPFTYLGNSP